MGAVPRAWCGAHGGLTSTSRLVPDAGSEQARSTRDVEKSAFEGLSQEKEQEGAHLRIRTLFLPSYRT